MTQQPSAVAGGVAGSAGMRPQMPAWAAGVAAVVFLTAIGVFIYWFLGGSFGGTSGLIPDPARAERPQGRQGGWRNTQVDGVQALPNGRGYLVRAGTALMDVETAADGKRPARYTFRYEASALLNREQLHFRLGLRRIGDDALMARTLAVTPEQLAQLRKFGQVTMEIAKADQAKVVGAWEAYQKASNKVEPEKQLVAALKEVGAKGLAATKAKAGQRVAEIERVLTAEQVRELTKLGAGEKVTPIAGGKTGQ